LLYRGRRKISHKQNEDIEAADVMIIAYFAQRNTAIHEKTLWKVKALETALNHNKMPNSGTFTLRNLTVF
jgi:hypothetical protein